MGKAQSKRSVDITTENKEGVAVAEGESGKVGKIEEVDQKPQLNGEANKDADSGTNEKQEEKKDEGAENEKDAATEKNEQPEVEPAKAAEEGQEAEKPAENGSGDAAAAAENVADTTTGTLDESKDGVEATGDDAAATDSAKKPKKEKSKKRFLSFRSFSFNKKDKTKPKKEEAAANTTNGECEKVPEEGTEDAAAVATDAVAAADDAAPAVEEKTTEPVTNGTTEEVKTNGESAAAPVATPEETVTPPSTNGDSKPIVEAAKETVDEVIVAASKSVDEKLNTVAKPEVNKNADQDLQETHIQALDNAEHEKESQSSESANIDTVPNNINENDNDTCSNGVVVDCTNNSLNNDNDNINSQPAPPLPDNPPPSQIIQFAETAMSVDSNQVENPQTVPVIATDLPIIQSESALVIGDTNIEVASPIESVPIVVTDIPSAIDIDTETVVNENVQSQIENVNEKIETVDIQSVPVEIEDEKLATSNEQIQSNSQSQNEINVETESEIEPELPKPDEEVAQTIEMLDRVNLNETDVKSIENVVTETNTETLESADISSPLPQNSLESLPSPQSLSSNVVTPPNENDDSATVELTNDDAASLPPPPPMDDDDDVDIVPIEKPTTEQSGIDATTDVDDVTTNIQTQNGNDDMLLPPPPVQELNDENDIVDELKTNGVNVDNHPENNQNHSVEASNGDGNLNGSAKEHDEAANNISDKANGVATDNGVSEKLNGDHKPEEIAVSPEKLEKLAAANPPPSTEVVAAE